MALLNLRDIHLSYGHPPLLDGVSLAVEEGERVCLIGRNGEGKSTLLKIIGGEISPDEGERLLRRGARVARLEQEVPAGLDGSVFDVVADGLGELAALVKVFHAASVALEKDAGSRALERLANAQQALEQAGGWQLEQQVEEVISRMGLDGQADFETLSGGMKRRVLLARALAGRPDLLLLDEPTNHLDIESIAWLESFLAKWRGALIFVTHDRSFLRSLASRIVELERGRLRDFPGDYDNYLRRREELENAEAQEQARLDKRLAQEEAWIRQGIKARRTRNEGRVRRLQAMREAARARRQPQGQARLALDSGERSGRLVCEAEHISYAWEGRPIVQDFSTTILRGDRIGIIGPNGCGKSTLLNLLLGRLKPDAGRVRLGSRLQIAYFDQLREQLDPQRTVEENVAQGSDKVVVEGREKHVISYLADFLFTPDRARQPVHALSGGERNRLLLARLFTRPANLLVMDEPTNDLDLETLELLEERLLDFDGTLLLVSHDRAFLDNVVTSTLVFEGEGRIAEYVGGYTDWLRQRPQPSPPKAAPRPRDKGRQRPASASASPRKLGYKEQRELAALPGRIEALEAEITEIQTLLADPTVYEQRGPDGLAALGDRLRQLESELEQAYARWEELE
ncbi:MAG: ATP-binding cassette domain-containing protein [Gammaproteobacteria bacterium]|nr:MAG: ATP-binding cassette domain-containing protein [Gammaproteobacteria bacterium]